MEEKRHTTSIYTSIPTRQKMSKERTAVVVGWFGAFDYFRPRDRISLAADDIWTELDS